ncbi:hypothetical protein CR513_53738, partial [Mucuna pruriens]
MVKDLKPLTKQFLNKLWSTHRSKYEIQRKKKLEGNARVKHSTLQALRRDFEILKMKVGETITKYFA